MTHINQRRDSASNWTAANPVLQEGEVGWETNTRKAKLGNGTDAWADLDYIIENGVTSVNGQTGAVVLDKDDIGLGSVDNTPDTGKPVSTVQAAALALKANLASPTFTGDPKAPTPTSGDSDTSIATTAFVDGAIGDFAGAVVVLTNKDLTDPTNEFPPSLGQVVGYATDDTDIAGIVSFNTVVSVAPVDEVNGAVYRVTGYLVASSDTAGGYTTLTIENARTGGPTIEVAKCVKDHRVATRREGITVVGIYEGTLDVVTQFWLSVTPGGGETSVWGDASSLSLLTIERIA